MNLVLTIMLSPFQSVLKQAYLSLVKHMNTIFKVRILYIMVEGFLMKYVWSAAGLVMIALPIFSSATRGGTITSTFPPIKTSI